MFPILYLDYRTGSQISLTYSNVMIAAAVQRYQFACEQFNTKSGSYHQHYMTHVQGAKGVYLVLVYLYSDKVEDTLDQS